MKILILIAIAYIGYRLLDMKSKLDASKKEQISDNEPDEFTDYEEVD